MNKIQRSYVPRTQRKIRWRIVAPLLVLAALLFYMAIVFFWPKDNVEPVVPFTICDYGVTKTKDLLHDRIYDETVELGDYLLYGETLNLFQSTYDTAVDDGFVGKTMKLYDLCRIDEGTDEPEYTFLLENLVDGQIPLENLEPGFYEIYVTQDLISKRIIKTEVIKDRFYTIRRTENTGKSIELLADKRLANTADDQPSLMDKNYVFLNVEASEIPSEIADIYIEAGHRTPNGGGVETGRSANGLIEAEETYKMALRMKEEFEKYGLKVVLAREDAEVVVDSYGLDGRLHKAYQAKAKYYIEIQLNGSSNPSVRGQQIFYSSFSSNRLATTVFKSLMEVPGFKPTSIYTRGNIPGVNASSRDSGLDARPTIRESGGRILAAGTYSDLSREGNASFAAEAILGMQTLTIEYGFITNLDDASFWKQNMDELAVRTVEGFVQHLQLNLITNP